MMSDTTILQELDRARSAGYAVGAFNIFDYTSARAVVAAAEECGKPVILQTSVGTVTYYGARELAEMLRYLLKSAKVPAFLHLDHCRDVAFAKTCVDAGWDSVMIDASAQSIERNIAMTREAADYAHAHGVYVEGEIGVIEGVEEEIAADQGKHAEAAECFRFAEESRVDYLAPAIGTAHGVYTASPKLNFDLAERLGRELSQPIVLHGGTGLTEETFTRLISLGIAKVNVSTALKHAGIDGAQKYIREKPEEYNPLHFDESMYASLKEVVKRHILIFANGR